MDARCVAVCTVITSACVGSLSTSPAPRPTVDELHALADAGDVQARFALANRYADGDGVARDNVLAYMWYGLAAERLAGPERYESLRAREILDGQMFRHQIAEADRLARIWKARVEP